MRAHLLLCLTLGCTEYHSASQCAGEQIFDDDLGAGWTFDSDLTAELHARTAVATGNFALEVTLDKRYGLVQFHHAAFDTAGFDSVCLWLDDTDAPLDVGMGYAPGTTACPSPCEDVGDGTCWCWRSIAPSCLVEAGAWWRCEVPLVDVLQAGTTQIDEIGIQFNQDVVDPAPAIVHIDNLTMSAR